MSPSTRGQPTGFRLISIVTGHWASLWDKVKITVCTACRWMEFFLQEAMDHQTRSPQERPGDYAPFQWLWKATLSLVHLWIISAMLGFLKMFLRGILTMEMQCGHAAGVSRDGYWFSIWCSGGKVWAEDTVTPVMFITAQRQLWSENLRVAEGNPFTSLPQVFPVGCLIQVIDSNHSCPAPKLPIDLPFWRLLVGNLITATYVVI